MTTALEIITGGLRLFGIIDQTEQPSAADISTGVQHLNDMLRSDMMDGACQFLINRVVAQLPAGVSGSIYSFSLGTADSAYTVQVDAVAVRAIWLNDIQLNV